MSVPDRAYDDSCDTVPCPSCHGKPEEYLTDKCVDEAHDELQGTEHSCYCPLCENVGEVHPSVRDDYLED